MIGNTYFYDLPVYRLPSSEYYDKMNQYVADHMYIGSPSLKKMTEDFYQKEPGLKNAADSRLCKKYGGPWDYNEIIGYVRLHFLGTQVRGEYWAVNAKRITRSRKKLFEYKTHKLAPEIDLHWELDSSAIFNRILEYLDMCRKELRDRYIDDENLLRIGPYVNWKSLYEDSKKA